MSNQPISRRFEVLQDAGDHAYTVHAAGCSDVAAARRQYPTANHYATRAATALEAALDEDDRELGYTDADVRVMPCAAPLSTLTLELVEAVKRHAEAHYEDGGWDVIVECWEDGDIAEQIGRARTVAGALRKFEGVVDVWADRQADAAYHRSQAGE